MKFEHTVRDNVLVLDLEGDLIGQDNGLEVIEIVNKKIEESITLCIINISGLRYINSSGIGVLITVLTKFRNKGGEICLLKPSESVKKLLIITKLNAIFNIVEEEEQAFKTLKSTV